MTGRLSFFFLLLHPIHIFGEFTQEMFATSPLSVLRAFRETGFLTSRPHIHRDTYACMHMHAAMQQMRPYRDMTHATGQRFTTADENCMNVTLRGRNRFCYTQLDWCRRTKASHFGTTASLINNALGFTVKVT